MKVIITGSTGMVGKGVLLECVESEHVDEILIVNRSPIGEEFPKTKELLVQDFFDLSPIEDQLKGYDACYFNLGTTAVGKSEEQYSRITYDLTLNFAKTLVIQNPEMVFTYVSGTGTSTKMNSSMMWANVKGKTENDLLEMGFKDAYMFRPGIILPLKGIRTKMWYQFLYDVMRPLNPLFRKMKSVTDTIRIGQAMINVTLNPQEKKILEPEDINAVSG
jgi:uncharacterized protein YbjT (DUF2867 family)